MTFRKPAGKGAVERIKLDSAASHIIEECRMVLPGIQALFGFQHRQTEPKEVSERFVWPSSNILLAAMYPLAVAIALDVYVVATVVAQSDAAGALVAAALLVVFALLWIFVP